MRSLIYWPTAARFKLRRAPLRGALAGAALPVLALGMIGLITTPAASAAPAQPTANLRPPRTPPPTRTPTPTHIPSPPPTHTPTPTHTPSPTPTSTRTPRPTATPIRTATATPTARAAGTGNLGTPGGSSTRPGDGSPAADARSGSLLLWGLGGLVAAALAVGTIVVLVMLRMNRAEQRPAFVPPAPRAAGPWRTEFRQVRPGLLALPSMPAEKTEEALPEEDDGWEELTYSQQIPSVTPLQPPRWMIDAGLLKEETGERPAADQQEPYKGEDHARGHQGIV
jgi:hypothetical protein